MTATDKVLLKLCEYDPKRFYREPEGFWVEVSGKQHRANDLNSYCLQAVIEGTEKMGWDFRMKHEPLVRDEITWHVSIGWPKDDSLVPHQWTHNGDEDPIWAAVECYKMAIEEWKNQKL